MRKIDNPYTKGPIPYVFGVSLPGAGKGTHIPIIETALQRNLTVIGTGNIFRQEIANKTPIGLEVSALIARGELASDELTIRIIEPYMLPTPTFFDGAPRTPEQVDMLDEQIKRYMDLWKTEIKTVGFNLEIEIELAVQRIVNRARDDVKMGKPPRLDDLNEKTVRNRIKIALRNNGTVLEAMDKKNIPILPVDANKNLGDGSNLIERTWEFADFFADHGFTAQKAKIAKDIETLHQRVRLS